MSIPTTRKERVWDDPDTTKGQKLVFDTKEFRIGAVLLPAFCIGKIIITHGYLYLDSWNIMVLLISPVIGGLSFALASILWKEIWG